MWFSQLGKWRSMGTIPFGDKSNQKTAHRKISDKQAPLPPFPNKTLHSFSFAKITQRLSETAACHMGKITWKNSRKKHMNRWVDFSKNVWRNRISHSVAEGNTFSKFFFYSAQSGVEIIWHLHRKTYSLVKRCHDFETIKRSTNINAPKKNKQNVKIDAPSLQ